VKRCRPMRRIFLLSLVLLGVVTVRALAEDTPPSADESRRAEVFAKVGTATITVGELEDIINARSPYARMRFVDPEVLKEFADEQVRSELFYQGAEKLGYAENPAVRQFVDQTLVQTFVREDFEEAVTPDDVPAEDVTKYYDEHSEEFRRPEMRRARHILVASEKEADTILEELRADAGATFRALAKQESLDTETNMRGGDLLYFTEDGKLVGKEGGESINPTLAKSAFALASTGDLSKPLDLGDEKWSVLELTGIRPERIQTLEQASGLIRRKLWRAEREGALDELMANLRTELQPELHPERMGAIVLEPSSEPIEPPNQ
jgi:peptidyl-prolyl cis-trans isomerase C